MRGPGDHRDLLALERLGRDVDQHRVAPRHEARGRPVVGIREIDAPARLRRYGERGDHRLGAVLAQRLQQRVEAAHLDRAGDLELLADEPRKLDVEAGRTAVGARVVERRIVEFGQEADLRDARDVGPLRAPPRVPEARHRDDRRRARDCSAACGSAAAGTGTSHRPASSSTARPARRIWLLQRNRFFIKLTYRELHPGRTAGLLIDQSPGRNSGLRSVGREWAEAPRREVPRGDAAPARPLHRPIPHCPELDCLRHRLPPETLAVAAERATELGIGADRVLIAARVIGEDAYLVALAASLRIAYEPLDGPRGAVSAHRRSAHQRGQERTVAAQRRRRVRLGDRAERARRAAAGNRRAPAAAGTLPSHLGRAACGRSCSATAKARSARARPMACASRIPTGRRRRALFACASMASSRSPWR